MKSSILKVLMTLSSLSLTFLLPVHCRAQEGGERAVVLGRLVEFSVQAGGEKADFDVVSVLVEGELIKKFSASVTFFKVIATFNGPEGDYLLLRTSMGSGTCVGGDLYALKFYKVGQGEAEQLSVKVSPKLTTCLSEYPWVKFEYDDSGTVIRIAGYELKDPWLRWTTEARAKKAAAKRR